MATEKGVRERNEDACIARPDLLAVADGMGGYAGGEVAARVALLAIEQPLPSGGDDGEAVGARLALAHAQVREAATSRPEWREMGTTLTALWVRGGRAIIGHVGDSRAYLVRDGLCRQLTQDHSVTAELLRSGSLTEEEARSHPHRHVLTRSLGGPKEMAPDILDVSLQAGDRLVLCTDGVTALVDAEVIGRITGESATAQEAASRIVAQAVSRAPTDNVTVAVGFVESQDIEQEAPSGVQPT